MMILEPDYLSIILPTVIKSTQGIKTEYLFWSFIWIFLKHDHAIDWNIWNRIFMAALQIKESIFWQTVTIVF
jgi:hypothetical protein